MSAPQWPTSPRAGWYDDPGDPRAIRYWDGVAWSAHAAPKPPGWGQPSETATPPTKSPWWRRRWAIATAVVLVLIFGGAALSDSDESPKADAADGASSVADEDSAEPTPDVDVQEAKPTPPKSTVPRVSGLAGKQAKRKLAAVGLVAFVAREVPSPRPTGTVLRQLKAAGTSIREGSSVGLVIAAPYPTVPGTAGMAQAAAAQRLRNAGFQVRVAHEVVTSGRDGAVLRQTPVGSSRVRPHSVITLVIANVVRPVVAPPPSNCTPGYSPCLAPASDYDCAGGSGNGPGYTGLVYVTGSDPYDLDADGDGVACES
jgi:resuscitation-promoting factor RpfB